MLLFVLLIFVSSILVKFSLSFPDLNSSSGIYRNIEEILGKYQARQYINYPNKYYPEAGDTNGIQSQYGLYYPLNQQNEINSNYGLYYPNKFPRPTNMGSLHGGYPNPLNYADRYQPQGTINEVLNSITQYDTYQCVARLLCEMTVGRNTHTHTQSSSSSLTSFLPSLDLSSIVSLIEAFNPGGQPTPLFVFGKAALLGYSSSGNKYACYRAYPKCPRDPDDLVEYLNNHNGGFFRFFSGIQQNAELYRPHPGYRPYPHLYPNQYSYDANQRIESRIQTKPESNPLFSQGNYLGKIVESQPQITKSKSYGWKFPQDISEAYQSFYSSSDSVRKGKTLQFLSQGPTGFGFVPDPHIIKVVFPDRTGTGELLIDSEKYPPPEHIRYESTFYGSQVGPQKLKFPTSFEGNRLF